MSLDFGKNDVEAMIVMKGALIRIDNDLYNHGQDGLITQFKQLKTTLLTSEKERERQHETNLNKLNAIIGILSVLALIFTAIASYIAIIISVHGGGHSLEQFVPFPQNQQTQSLYAGER